MSALPKAVQKQVAEANRLAEQIKAGTAPTPDPNTPPAPQPVAAQPSAVPAPQPAPVQPNAPGANAQPEESWERKYRILQGKYNAEVPRLSQQVRDLTTTNQNLQTQLTTLQAVVTSLGRQQGSAPAAQPAAPTPPAKQRLVKDDEVKQFGPDLIDVIRRVAREELPAAPSAPPAAPAQVVQQVQQVQQQVQQITADVAENKQQKMFALLDERVPEWKTLNDDVEFIAWLEQVDPFAGVKRIQMFDEAAARFDGPRVAAFFKGYQNEHAATTPSAQPAPAAQPAQPQQPAPTATPAPLDRLVAPGAARAGAAGAPNEAQKRIYTRAEIDAFAVRKNKFVIQGRKVPQALVDEEREILRAANEGRISG